MELSLRMTMQSMKTSGRKVRKSMASTHPLSGQISILTKDGMTKDTADL